MSDKDKLPDLLAEVICKHIEKAITKASFDKSSIGRIVSKESGYYKVKAFGGTFDVESDLAFNVNQRVAVVAPQGNMHKLYMLAI